MGLMPFLNGGPSMSAMEQALIEAERRRRLEEAKTAAIDGGPDPSMSAIAPPAAAEPGKPKGFSPFGLDPMTLLGISSSFAKGASGGGWGAALDGVGDTFERRRRRLEDDGRSDAQRRALAAMQTGDMKTAIQILGSNKQTSADALGLQAGIEEEGRKTKREDQLYGRERADAAADHARDRGEKLGDYGRELGDSREDMRRQRDWKVEDREDEQEHDFDMLGVKAAAEGGFSDTNQLRNQYLGQVKTFADVRDAFGRINQIEKYVTSLPPETKSPASDISLVFNFMKMNDPSSTVREGEYATAQQAGSISSKVLNIYNGLLSGESLTPEQRKDFLSAARNLYVSQERSYGNTLDFYRGEAQRSGLDPSSIPDLRVADPNDETAPSGGPAAPPNDAPADIWPMLAPAEKSLWETLSPRGKELLVKRYRGVQDGLRRGDEQAG